MVFRLTITFCFIFIPTFNHFSSAKKHVLQKYCIIKGYFTNEILFQYYYVFTSLSLSDFVNIEMNTDNNKCVN